MMLRNFKPVWLMVLVISVVLATSSIGIVMAQSTSDSNTIYGAYQKVTGVLRIISDPSEVRPSEELIFWSKEGPPGPPGPEGPPGSDGRSVAIFTGSLLNPGDTATHTIYSLAGSSTSHLELLVVVWDINSADNFMYIHGDCGWYRESDSAPKKHTLPGGSYSSGPSYTWDTLANGNNIQVRVGYVGTSATNTRYRIIAKWFTVP